MPFGLTGLDTHEGVLSALSEERDSETGEYAAEALAMDEAYDTALEAALDIVLTTATEATGKGTKPRGHIIDKQTRDSLPDSAFGIPSKRKYPLIVKGNKEATHELISRSIQMFHYCNPEWKKELAGNIIKAIRKSGAAVTIHPKSMICKYTDVPKDLLSNDTEDKYHRPE